VDARWSGLHLAAVADTYFAIRLADTARKAETC
jgi:hypothetical protein